MSNEIIKRDERASFEEFKKTILERGIDDDFWSQVEKKHGQIPSLFRVLQNFDPTGISSAIDQIISEKTSEREQDNILQAIYAIAEKVFSDQSTDGLNLSDEKFQFLYYVYSKTETSIFSCVNPDNIQNILGISQNKIISIGQYLEQNGLIVFSSWVNGIDILHKGIIKIESDLLVKSNLPPYVNEDEIKKIAERIRVRLASLQYVYDKSRGDTFKDILHIDLAKDMELEHDLVITQLLPYMKEEGWVIYRSTGSITITEEGIDRARVFSNNPSTLQSKSFYG